MKVSRSAVHWSLLILCRMQTCLPSHRASQPFIPHSPFPIPHSNHIASNKQPPPPSHRASQPFTPHSQLPTPHSHFRLTGDQHINMINDTHTSQDTSQDTIAAIATAQGTGGIAIVRVSGPRAAAIFGEMFRPGRPRGEIESHRLMYGHAMGGDGSVIDEVMAVWMRAPSTYTREDVAEIHCHGGRVCARSVLQRALELGARMAGPGEFTRRAFLNGRIDLSRAEAVMGLVAAGSQAAARASVRQLEGGVSGFVRQTVSALTEIMALIEASADFPDEVEEETAAHQVAAQLRRVIDDIQRHCDARGARLLREGASIVLAGRPNVGKSSLMNALLEQERAIVTDVPGTTRDVLTERISLGGVAAELSDTAGQRTTQDPVERIGVDRARRAMETADVVLIVLDAAEALEEEDAALIRGADERAIVCLNKTDLRERLNDDEIRRMTGATILSLSARTGAGMDRLVEELTRRVAVDEVDGTLTVHRHMALAQEAADALKRAVEGLGAGFPLDTAAIDIREALEALTTITGENATEAVIDRVFEAFCVGK